MERYEMNRVSIFFANFSLGESVKHKLHLPASYPNNVSRSDRRSFLGHGQFLSRRSESFTCPVYVSDYVSFDEQGFITSLREEVEKEIIDNTAAITRQGNIEGNFNSSEFFFEYAQGGIKGRIVISGKRIESGYYLTADLEEIAEGAGFPLTTGEFSDAGANLTCAVTTFGGSSFAADEFRRGKPEGGYYVALFMRDDPLAQDDKFLSLGVEFIKESRKRMTRGITKGPSNDSLYAEVWSLLKMPRHVKQLLSERGMELNDEEPDEYKEYEKVYFLNEVALRMYREGGISLEALKKVSVAEMPKRCNRVLRGPYVP